MDTSSVVSEGSDSHKQMSGDVTPLVRETGLQRSQGWKGALKGQGREPAFSKCL